MLEVWKPNFERGKNFSMLCLASRGSGKSYTTKYLLEYELRDKYDSFVVFCQSPDELEEYREILPGKLFFDEFKPEVINRIIEINNKRKTDGLPMLETLVIFDDQISNKMKYDDDLLQLFTRGRHVGVSVIFISQSHTFAAASWRNNSDIIMLLKQNSKQSRDSINDNILIGSLDPPDDVNEKKFYMGIMKEHINQPGDSLVLDYREGAFNNLYKYRAPKREFKEKEKPKDVTPPEILETLQAKTEEKLEFEFTEKKDIDGDGIPDVETVEEVSMSKSGFFNFGGLQNFWSDDESDSW